MIEGNNYDTVYLDYQKAFDKCDQGVASHAIRRYGFQGQLGVWLLSFMTGRTQHVIANNQISYPSNVRSGVPQGSVLGPIIFILSIESINNNDIVGNLGLFADDTREGFSISSEKDAMTVQEDLMKLGEWSEDINMAFNNLKFECLKAGFKEELKNKYNYLTPNLDHIIEVKDNIKDLGVWMSYTGNF